MTWHFRHHVDKETFERLKKELGGIVFESEKCLKLKAGRYEYILIK